MSRFFAVVGQSDSDSSDDEIQEPVRRQTYAYSSDEGNVKRVVKPAREKYTGELRNIVQQINNHKKIKDYASLLTAFDEMIKIHEKSRNSLLGEPVPPFLIICLLQLTEFVSAAWDDIQGRKALSKTGFKSLTALRQKLRKFSKCFEDELNNCNNNPEAFDVDEIQQDVVEADVEEKSCAKSDQESSDFSDFSDKGSDSESDDENTPYENIRDRFLKKTETVEEESKKKERKEKKRNETKAVVDEEDGWEIVTGHSSALSDQKLFAKDSDVNKTSVLEKLGEILKLRRLKRAERLHRIGRLKELVQIVEKHQLGPVLKAKIRICQILGLFEYNLSATEPMKTEHWHNVLEYFDELIDLLRINEISVADNLHEENEELENQPQKIQCSLSGILVRLVDEFRKILKCLDPFKNEFREKFKDEKKIGEIIDKVLYICHRTGTEAEISRVMLCKIEHIYYKVDAKVFDDNYKGETSLDEIDKLCKFIYVRDKTQRLRTRAILSQIYHLALHNKWTAARDLFLMSNLQSGIEFADPATQILYNRSLTQMALCAFRIGNFSDAHNCISDLVTSGRLRDLIGQEFVMGRNADRTHEQELRERQFQTPFHMTINLDVIDAIYLISSMLIDIPALAARENTYRSKAISKLFYLQLRMIDRMNLVGPPESIREHVVAASGALKNAKWRECLQFLINPKMKKKVWDLMIQPSMVETLLEKEIKKQGLKTFIRSYGSVVYETLDMEQLSKMFETTISEVETIIAEMILEEDLKAAIHGPTNTILFDKNYSKTSMQIVACQLVEKLNVLMDCNERCCVPGRHLRSGTGSARQGRFTII